MKRNILIYAFMAIVCFVNGQDKVYFDSEGQITKNVDTAVEYKIVEKSVLDRDSLFKLTRYYISGQKKSESSYLKVYKNNIFLEQKDIGEDLEWFEDGSVHLKSFYKDGKLHGDFITFWPNGIQRRKDIFDEGNLIEGNCYDSVGNRLPDYFPYETMPEFPGGEKELFKYLNKTINYPREAIKQGIQGRVIVQYYVGADGKITDIRIVRKVNDYLDMEAFRVVKSMPDWIPGTQEGEKVRVKYTLPINFRIK